MRFFGQLFIIAQLHGFRRTWFLIKNVLQIINFYHTFKPKPDDMISDMISDPLYVDKCPPPCKMRRMDGNSWCSMTRKKWRLRLASAQKKTKLSPYFTLAWEKRELRTYRMGDTVRKKVVKMGRRNGRNFVEWSKLLEC